MPGAAVSRRAARRKVARDAGVPYYAADFAPVRGRCLRPVRRGVCGSRYGIVRVSIDLRSRDRVDRLATVECAVCGHTWRRVRPPERVTSRDGYQSVRLTLILPAADGVHYSRATRKRTTSDGAVTLTNATIPDLIAATEDWRKRNAVLLAARERLARRKAEAEAVQRERTAALFARIAEREAEIAAEEAAAAAREA